MLLDPKCNWQPFPVTTLVAYHPLNRHGRDYVIGDLHGQWQALQRALGEVAFDPARDRLFSVGDLADRGPDSLRCLQIIVENILYYNPLKLFLLMVNFLFAMALLGAAGALAIDSQRASLLCTYVAAGSFAKSINSGPLVCIR